MADPTAAPTILYDVDEHNLASDERLLNLYRLWNAKRGARSLPARADFDLAELAPWFGNLILLDVLDGGKDFRYRLFGVILAQEAGFDMTGKKLSEYPIPSLLPHFYEVFREVILRRKPAMSEHDPSVPNVRRRRRLILPLAKDGETVDMIMTFNYAVEVVHKPEPYL